MRASSLTAFAVATLGVASVAPLSNLFSNSFTRISNRLIVDCICSSLAALLASSAAFVGASPALTAGTFGGTLFRVDDWPRAGGTETPRTQTNKMDTRAKSTRREILLWTRMEILLGKCVGKRGPFSDPANGPSLT